MNQDEVLTGRPLHGLHVHERYMSNQLIQLDLSEVASLSIPSWNQIAGFLESMRRLRESAGFAA